MRAFALSPGVVRTRMYVEAGVKVALNTVELLAATAPYLTSGHARGLAFWKVCLISNSFVL